MTFYEKMRTVCLAIPCGRVATYGQIALLCGKPRNARQVGYALREGPHDMTAWDWKQFCGFEAAQAAKN